MSSVFKAVGTLTPFGGPILKSVILKNSEVTVIGDAIKYTTGAAGTGGFATAASTTGVILGHVVAHTTNLLVPVLSTGAAGATFGSYVGSYTAASNNQTVNMDRVQLDISKNTVWSNATSGTLGTTTGSNVAGYHFNLSDKSTLDETSAVTTSAQYQSLGVDPNASTLVNVNIYTSQYFN